MKRTELRRFTPIRSRSSLLRGSGLAPASPKRAKQNRERAKLLAPLREAQTWCARCGRTDGIADGHEVVRRSQEAGAALNPDLIVLICRFPCHDWITTHPTEAHAEGWHVYGWERRQGIA